MCTGTANTDFILRHTTTPPIPSTSQAIKREHDRETPTPNRRSASTFLKRKQRRTLPLFPLGLCWDNCAGYFMKDMKLRIGGKAECLCGGVTHFALHLIEISRTMDSLQFGH